MVSKDSDIVDVGIIGAGPVGLFSIVSCGMLGIKSICIESLGFVGGQCSALYPAKKIYGIPGFVDQTSKEFVECLHKQTEEYEPRFFLNHNLIKIKKEDDYFILQTNKGDFRVRAVLLTSGKGSFLPNKITLSDAEKFENDSIFYSVRDKSIFKNKNVCILGGGDSAVDWCNEIAEIANKVTIVHRRNNFRCSVFAKNKMINSSKKGKIDIKILCKLHCLIGDDKLNAIQIINLESGKIENIKTDFLLPFFGLVNQAQNFGLEKLSISDNRIVVNLPTMESSIEGLFAAGDVCSYNGKLSLIVNGFAEATSAVMGIKEFINPASKSKLIDIFKKK